MFSNEVKYQKCIASSQYSVKQYALASCYMHAGKVTYHKCIALHPVTKV